MQVSAMSHPGVGVQRMKLVTMEVVEVVTWVELW